MNNDNTEYLINEYNKHFATYVEKYDTAEKQAESFRILSFLKNVQTNETASSVIEK